MDTPDYTDKIAAILTDGLSKIGRFLATEIDGLDARLTVLEERSAEEEGRRIARAEGRTP